MRRHGSSGSWGSSGSHGSSGSWGSSGSHGSSGSWGSSGSHGSYGSHGSHGGTVILEESDEAVEPETPALPEGPDADEGAAYRIDSRSVLLSVTVPENASLFVNDAKTRSTGAFRRFVSRGLQPGASYTYTVRAEIDRNGKTLTDEKTIKVTGGTAARVAFNFDESQSDEQVAEKPLVTSLTLNVPAEAKVFLAGQPTKSYGPVREFSTTRLTSSSQWADYPVRVEIQRDGETLVRTAQVSLKAGEKRKLTIDFDVEKVARAEK